MSIPADSETPEPHDSMIDVINVYKKDVDRTLLRENLKLTVEERFQKFESFWKYAQELRAARKNPIGLPHARIDIGELCCNS